jgi:hypothetical protein
VVNALVANDDMTGRDGHRTPALPRDQVIDLLTTAGRLSLPGAGAALPPGAQALGELRGADEIRDGPRIR